MAAARRPMVATPSWMRNYIKARDVDTYKRLYGLNPLLVHQLSESFAAQES